MSDDSSSSFPQRIDLNQEALELGLSFEPPHQLRARLEQDRLSLQHQLEEEQRQKQHDRETTQAEDQHKRTLDEQEAVHRRRIFWAVFSVVIITGAVALWVGFFDQTASPEAQAWARTLGSAIVAGIVGYFSGASGRAAK